MSTAFCRFFNSAAKDSLICFFSSDRIDYKLKGEKKDSSILKNRKKICKNLNINWQDLVCVKQVHGAEVYIATSKDKGRGAVDYDTVIDGYDAIVTTQADIPICVFTADCLSVFFYEPQTKCIGLAHAGWRSTKAGILENLVKKMQENFFINTKSLMVGLGPCIRNCCYEVRPDVASNFPETSIVKRQGRLYLDLIKENLNQLFESGVKEENIVDCGVCTVCNNKNFFSYRIDGPDCGRNISLMMLRED